MNSHPDKPIADLIASFEHRLGSAAELTAPAVAAAMGVSHNTVLRYIDGGQLLAKDMGTKRRPYWKICRGAALAFYRARLLAGSGGTR